MEIAIGVEVFMEKKEKALLIIIVIQTVFPWLVLVTGIPAMYCWMREYYEVLEILYSIAMKTGMVSLVLEFVLGIISLILFIVSIIKNNTNKSIVLGAVSWIYSGGCIAGTFILMFFVAVFTYGQSV